MSSLGSPFPVPAQLRVALEECLGRPVRLASGPSVLPTSSMLTVAEYVDRRLATVAIVAWDLAASCSIGAAASRHTPTVAAEAARARSLRTPLELGLREVAQDLVGLFAHPQDGVRLYAVTTPRTAITPTVAGLLARGRRRLDLCVQPSTYGAGRCSVVAAR